MKIEFVDDTKENKKDTRVFRNAWSRFKEGKIKWFVFRSLVSINLLVFFLPIMIFVLGYRVPELLLDMVMFQVYGLMVFFTDYLDIGTFADWFIPNTVGVVLMVITVVTTLAIYYSIGVAVESIIKNRQQKRTLTAKVA